MNGIITPENPLFFPENEAHLSLMEKHIKESIATQLNINLTSKKANKLRDITCVIAGFPGGYQQLKEYWSDSGSSSKNNLVNICEEALVEEYSEININKKEDGYSLKFSNGCNLGKSKGYRVSRNACGNMSMHYEVVDQLRELLKINKSEKLNSYYKFETMLLGKMATLFVGLRFDSKLICNELSIKIIRDDVTIFQSLIKDAIHENAKDIRVIELENGYEVHHIKNNKARFYSRSGSFDECNILQLEIIDEIKKLGKVKDITDLKGPALLKMVIGNSSYFVMVVFGVRAGQNFIDINIHKDLEIDELDINEIKKLKDSTKRKSGIILISGVTGSGKTTTLKALSKYAAINKNVQYTDKIEFDYEDVSYAEHVNKDELFGNLAKGSIKRRADVVVMNELRTPEHVDDAIRLSKSGALVITTIYGASMKDTREHFEKLSGDKFSFVHLAGILHQKLVKGKCKKSVLISNFVDTYHLSDVKIKEETEDGITFDLMKKHKNGEISLEVAERYMAKS